MKKTLTIAGSDSTGGAGLQADLKTFQELNTFGMSAITSIVTMAIDNNWSHDIETISPETVRRQLKTIFAGGNPDALKTGMLGDIRTITVVREMIDHYHPKNIVIDPVLACKGTAGILLSENADSIRKLLLPVADITTPNLVEAGILSGMGDLKTTDDMKNAAKIIHNYGAKNVVIKGGRRLDGAQSIDLFYDGKNFHKLTKPMIHTDNNHGAGCTFAAAITASLANGECLLNAVKIAKTFVHEAISQGAPFNNYLGHIWHGAYRNMTHETGENT
ncbi:hydroxymethylpyrimidine/phosphomethylpyrimidine kinase [Lactococcus hodotermopsidis]|uniref:pyridoxal kinase n=1 Tax=Pseudolactococcus hodotermopsidis TaxID=2709157 RepID=A0A6A0BHM5_9LACT|nr:bifunctional hydroxymethylpyrimidine kinase/phosphomethylpyrimidine kinase [Lactococcus hodotermopsidis]GFH43297.1 hydroxymethylpyrimidine/phosphomethylpyrimidine kinase [Lactococcus hodotermopsidis]